MTSYSTCDDVQYIFKYRLGKIMDQQDACSGVESACKHQIHYLKQPIPTD